MAIPGLQQINIGLPNESAGSDSLYTAFNKAANNFSNLFTNASPVPVAGNGIAVDTTGSNVTLSANLIAGDNIVISNVGSAVRIDAVTGGPSGSITGVLPGTGLTGGGYSGNVTLGLATSGVVAASYTNPTITVDAQGRITSASNNTVAGTVTSVGLLPGTGIGISGGPVTSAGNITVTNTGVTRLSAGTGITVSGSTGNVTISATPPAAVTSVGISSSQLVITGSPIISAGTIAVNLPANATFAGNVSANIVYANLYRYANGAPLSTNAGGINTQLQYNNNGVFAGVPNVTWNGSALSLGNIANVKITGGENGYFLQTDGTGNLTWSPASGGIPPLDVQQKDETLFGYRFWTVNGPRSLSVACVSDPTSVTAYVTTRRQNDLAALIWAAEDTVLHECLKRETVTDYSGVVLSFDYSVSGQIPDIDDEQLGAVLTIEYQDSSYAYVRLQNYRDSGTARAGRFTLNFDTLMAGYYADEPVVTTGIARMFFNVRTVGYVAGSTLPMADPQHGSMTVANIVCNTNMIVNSLRLAAHRVGMCTSYDDSYNMTPERLVETIYQLGYRGLVTHYCGMSHYYDQKWVEGEGRFNVVADNETPGYTILNMPTTEWHAAFCASLKANRMQPILSISYELFSEACPFAWAQRAWDDSYGVTGYTPPSYLLSPCIVDAMSYLQAVFVDFAHIMDGEGVAVMMQIGEPWWWWNADGKPCFYDYSTRVKFNDETGLFAPEIPSIHATNLRGTPYDEFKAFLKKELGNSVIAVKDAVVAEYPSARLGPLIFLPSITDERVGIVRDINFPLELWRYPEFGFIQTEVYDWIINAEMDKTLQAFYQTTDLMGYPADRCHYLAGFVPDNDLGHLINPDYDLAVDGPMVWSRILGTAVEAAAYNFGKTFLWAYPQVMRDSVVVMRESEGRTAYVNGDMIFADKHFRASDSDGGIGYPWDGPGEGEVIPDPNTPPA